MNLDFLKKKICRQYGDNVMTAEVAGTLVVHLDNPDVAERNRRQAEVREGNFGAEDNCPLCQQMKVDRPQLVIYDGESMLCLGSGESGMFATGIPRKNKKGT